MTLMILLVAAVGVVVGATHGWLFSLAALFPPKVQAIVNNTPSAQDICWEEAHFPRFF